MRWRSALAVAFGALVLTVGVAGAATQNIEVSPPSLSFGTFCLGTSSAAKPVTVANISDGESPDDDLVIQSIQRSGGQDAEDFARTSLTPASPIEPGKSSSFTVTFTPSARGVRAGKFTINSNDPNDPSVDVPFTGTGVDRKIAISEPDGSVAFGEQRVGTRSPNKTLIVSNPGQDAVTVTGVKRTGTNAGDFVVALPAPFTLQPAGTKSITIAFQPTAGGIRRGTLEISSTSCTQPKINVSLVGTGVLPNVAVQPNPIDAGSAAVGAKSKPTAITISNDGLATLEITGVQLIGTDAADFALSNLPPMPKTLQPEESFVFSLRMTPTVEGLRLATLNVLSDDPDGETFTIPVRGTALAATPVPSASASVSASPSPTPSPSGSGSPRALAGTPNDSLAIVLVVGGVLSAFVGLIVVRRFIRTPEDDLEA